MRQNTLRNLLLNPMKHRGKSIRHENLKGVSLEGRHCRVINEGMFTFVYFYDGDECEMACGYVFKERDKALKDKLRWHQIGKLSPEYERLRDEAQAPEID